MARSPKSLAVASALLVGLLYASDTNVGDNAYLYAAIGVIFLVFLIFLKIIE